MGLLILTDQFEQTRVARRCGGDEPVPADMVHDSCPRLAFGLCEQTRQTLILG